MQNFAAIQIYFYCLISISCVYCYLSTQYCKRLITTTKHIFPQRRIKVRNVAIDVSRYLTVCDDVSHFILSLPSFPLPHGDSGLEKTFKLQYILLLYAYTTHRNIQCIFKTQKCLISLFHFWTSIVKRRKKKSHERRCFQHPGIYWVFIIVEGASLGMGND